MRCVMPAYQHAQASQPCVYAVDIRLRILVTAQLQQKQSRTHQNRTGTGDRLDRTGIGAKPDIRCIGLHLLSMSLCLQSQVIQTCHTPLLTTWQGPVPHQLASLWGEGEHMVTDQ